MKSLYSVKLLNKYFNIYVSEGRLTDKEYYLYTFQKGFNYSQDGPGNRLVYHLAGCNLICPWCSNPEGMERFPSAQKRSVGEMLGEAVSCKMMFFDCGGVTLTGGEVSCQAKAAEEFIKNLRKKSIHTCIETNASLPGTVLLSECADYMIADFKSPDKEKLFSITEADLNIIKENLLYRAALQSPLLVRVPLINGFNTGAENARGFCEFFKELQSVSERVSFEILTYHEFGKDKYEKLGKAYSFKDGFVKDEDVKLLSDALKAEGLTLIKT